MGAPLGNHNSAGVSEGKGGTSLQDRKISARVRSLALKEIEKVLQNGREDKLYEPLLLKLASTVLPRINQVGGLEDEDNSYAPILVKFLNGKEDNNNTE